MSTSRLLFEQLAAQVAFGRDQGLDVEVTHILPEGWMRQSTPDGYIFTAALCDDNEDAMWRVVRFLSYKALFVCRGTEFPDRREYEAVSCMESGAGFRLLFQFMR